MLKISNINSFYGKAHILHDFNLSIEKGQIVALLGRNGAGKSTLLKSIMQLLRPKSGTIFYDDQSLIGIAPHKVAQLGLGYVPEDRRIFSDLTVLENLIVGQQPPREGTMTWTIDMLFSLFPNLAERRNNRGKALSGGEQQMLAIARTLMGNPAFLLLDEPSEGVAPVIVAQMAQVIGQLKTQGLTILLSEQNLQFAQAVADQAIIIESGVQKFHGTIDELKAQPAIRNAYLAA